MGSRHTTQQQEDDDVHNGGSGGVLHTNGVPPTIAVKSFCNDGVQTMARMVRETSMRRPGHKVFDVCRSERETPWVINKLKSGLYASNIVAPDRGKNVEAQQQ